MIDTIELTELKQKIVKDVNRELKHCLIKTQVETVIKKLHNTKVLCFKDCPEIIEVFDKLILVNCKNKIIELTY